MARSKLDLRGITVALTTPFKNDQTICYDSLKYNLDKYEQIPFRGYLVAGSNGEAPFLDHQERISLVKFVKENTESKIIIGNATAESTKKTIDLIKQMKDVGADGVLVMPPHYFKAKMTKEVLINHFVTVSQEGDLPLVIYNNPFVTGIDIPVDAIAELAKYPNIVGVKDNDVGKLSVLVRDTKGLNFDTLASMGLNLLGALTVGCSGAMVNAGNILGHEVCSIYDYFRQGKVKEAADLQRKISNIDFKLRTTGYGIPVLKAAMDARGYKGCSSRLPLLDPSEDDVNDIKNALKEEGFL